MIHQATSQMTFARYRDMITYQQEANALCDYIKSIKKQNANLLKDVKNMSKKIQENDRDLLVKVASVIDESTFFITQTAAAFSYYKHNTNRQSLIQLEQIITEHQKHLLKLREIESLILYAIPTPRSKK